MAKILIVDDERSIRTTFKFFLESVDHTVHTAENVEKAVSILKNFKIDLIITDIIMPRITGIELLKIINKTSPDISVVVMTGEPTIKTASESIKNSANYYLIKPVNKDTLLDVVKHQLYQKSLLDNQRRLEKENIEYKNNLERLVKERTKALQKAMSATVITMSSLLELRDPYTAGHQRAVGNLAVKIANKMHLKGDQVECIYVAGYLHDIGKISAPAEILSKPGELLDIEFEIIKRHVINGFDILNSVELPWPIAEVIQQHHERIDGSGYPNGIEGQDMRIEAKILAVADVIEAMNAHRPYRPSLGLKIALEEIADNRGIKFDEDVVDATLELFNKDNYSITDKVKEIPFEL